MNYLDSQSVPPDAERSIDLNIFYTVSVVFLCVFIYYGLQGGFKYGFKASIFTWCLTVCLTPISSASILFSFPIKIFTGIPMFFTKFLVSVICIFVLMYYYHYKYNFISRLPLGRTFIKMMNLRLYSIFIVAILSSIMTSYLLDYIVDRFILNLEVTTADANDNILPEVVVLIVSVFLIYTYFKIIADSRIYM